MFNLYLIVRGAGGLAALARRKRKETDENHNNQRCFPFHDVSDNHQFSKVEGTDFSHVLKFPTVAQTNMHTTKVPQRFCAIRVVLVWLTAVFFHIQLAAQVNVLVSGTPLYRQWDRKVFRERDRAAKVVDEIITIHQALGYLEVAVDTIWKSSALNIQVHAGSKHQIAGFAISGDSIPFAIPGSRGKEKRKPALSEAAITERLRRPITYLENHGYPFARLELEHFELADSLWWLSYRLHAGKLVRLDSLIIKSTGNLPARYIRNHLGWRKGEPYNEGDLSQIRSRLLEIPFVTIRQSPDLLFRETEADLYLYLERKKANTFNGIIGLQPQDGGGVTLTGDLEVRLLNAIQRGEEIYFNWRRLQSETQELHARTRLPYLFNTPFGTEGWVRIYRRDSTFSTFRGQLALAFNLRRGSEWKVFTERNSTSRLSRNVSSGDFADVRATLYGLFLSFFRLDYLYNPQKGLYAEWEAATGRRRASRPVAGTDDLRSINSATYRVQGNAGGYIPLFARQALHLRASGAALFADEISENEMFRIGGLKSIRGIDEEGIFANAWGVLTAEYRFILETNSALYIFADQAWYEASRSYGRISDKPLGFGAGTFFETKAGIFTFNYGLAKQFDNPVLLRNARLSFGFRNLF